jgi:dihydrofolate reductase
MPQEDKMKIALIAAIGKDHAIAVGDDLPWNLPDDVADFRRKIDGHWVLMGRKTYDTIGHPLKGSPTIVVTRRKDYTAEGAVVFDTIEEGLRHAREQGEQRLFILGGGEIYQATLPLATDLYLTHVEGEFENATAFFPPVDWEEWQEIPAETSHFPRSARNSHPFTIKHYHRK